MHSKILKIAGSNYTFVALCVLYPTVFLLGKNSYIYSGAQLAATFALLNFGAVIALAFAKGLSFLLKRMKWERFERPLLAGLGGALMTILFLGTIQEILYNRLIVAGVSLGVVLIIILWGIFIQIRPLNIVLVSLIVFNGVLWVVQSNSLGTTNIPTNNVLGKPLNSIKFKTKPNVYLVILESYQSPSIRSQTYHIDNEYLLSVLKKYQYRVAEHHYSNYNFTLASVSSLMMMKHHYYKYNQGSNDGGMYRKIIGGVLANPVLEVFLDNGYTIDYSKAIQYLYDPSPAITGTYKLALFAPFEVFKGVFSIYKLFVGSDLQKNHHYRCFLDLPIFQISPVQVQLPRQNSELPRLSLIYQGARHSPTSKSDISYQASMPAWKQLNEKNYWQIKYRDLSNKADSSVVRLVTSLEQKDPRGVVILIGDHGAWLQRDRWKGDLDDANVNMATNGIEPPEVTKDMFEVFSAIKYPQGTIPILISHVNIFRNLIAALAQDSSILNSTQPDNAFILERTRENTLATPRFYLGIQDGVILNNWLAQQQP
jgi:hypothetical protein